MTAVAIWLAEPCSIGDKKGFKYFPDKVSASCWLAAVHITSCAAKPCVVWVDGATYPAAPTPWLYKLPASDIIWFNAGPAGAYGCAACDVVVVWPPPPDDILFFLLFLYF